MVLFVVFLCSDFRSQLCHFLCCITVITCITVMFHRCGREPLYEPNIIVVWSCIRINPSNAKKPASENVVCFCRLLNILANFSNLFLHTGKQANLGPHCLQKLLLKSQADDKVDDNCCDWHLKG